MILRWAGRGATTLLALAILTNIVLMVRARLVAGEHQAMDIDGLLRDSTSSRPFAPLDGYTVEGQRDTRHRAISGWAVRYSSRSCKFCGEDTEWFRLAALLERAGLQITTILPRAEQEKAETSSQSPTTEFALVPMEFVGRVRITLTPTVLIFSPSGAIVWYQPGVLERAHVASAMKAVEAALRLK